MSRWIVKKGNTSVQKILIKDKEGNVVITLGVAEYIKFQVKKTKLGAAVIERTVAGGGIVVDPAANGFLTITLVPVNTLIEPMLYVMGLEVKWNDTNLYEVTMIVNGEESEEFEITQDIVLP